VKGREEEKEGRRGKDRKERKGGSGKGKGRRRDGPTHPPPIKKLVTGLQKNHSSCRWKLVLVTRPTVY